MITAVVGGVDDSVGGIGGVNGMGVFWFGLWWFIIVCRGDGVVGGNSEIGDVIVMRISGFRFLADVC